MIKRKIKNWDQKIELKLIQSGKRRGKVASEPIPVANHSDIRKFGSQIEPDEQQQLHNENAASSKSAGAFVLGSDSVPSVELWITASRLLPRRAPVPAHVSVNLGKHRRKGLLSRKSLPDVEDLESWIWNVKTNNIGNLWDFPLF